MKRFVALFLLLSLSGCFNDQKKQVAACQSDALHSYPTHRVLVGGNIGNYIRTCMTAHDYDWDISNKNCEFSNTTASNSNCYAPSGWFARKIYALEIFFGKSD
jgi:hypothetical protein